MSEPTFSSSSTRSRTQSVCDDTRKTTVHTQSHDGAIFMQITQKYTDPKRGHWNHGYETMHFADMQTARELATAINQSADWVESGKPVPLVKPTPPTPEPETRELFTATGPELAGMALLWGVICATAAVVVERMFL